MIKPLHRLSLANGNMKTGLKSSAIRPILGSLEEDNVIDRQNIAFFPRPTRE